MKEKTIIGIVAVVIIVVGVLVWQMRIAAPWGASPAAVGSLAEKETITIGAIVTVTGVGAYNGEQARKGLALAEEDLERAFPDTDVRVIVEDSGTEPAKATSATKKLIEVDSVDFLVGDSWTVTTAAFAPVVNEASVLLMAPLLTLDSMSQDDFVFRLMSTTETMMKPLANYVYDQGYRSTAILRQDNAFGVEHARDFEKAFIERGGRIVVEEHFVSTQNDLRSHLVKAKAHNPDVVFDLHATGPMVGLLIKQADELGLTPKLWIGSWGSENGALVKEYGETVEGLTYPYPYNPSANEKIGREFQERYQTRFGEKPDLTSAHFYDSLTILIQAIHEVGYDSHKVKEYLLAHGEFKGVSGTFSFDKNGDVERPIVIKRIHNGEFVTVGADQTTK